MNSLPKLNLEALDKVPDTSAIATEIYKRQKIARIILFALLSAYLFTISFLVFVDMNGFAFRELSYLVLAILVGFSTFFGICRWCYIFRYDFRTLSSVSMIIVFGATAAFIYYFYFISMPKLLS